MLMGIGSLATIAVQAPPNLSILVQDNEHYGETGGQETATRHGVDLVAMAKGAGIRDARLITSMDQVAPFRAAVHAKSGTLFAVTKIDAASKPLVLPPREGALLQARMREAILGSAAHLE
jgi:hypothetical protein